jgi:hypothetical protein
MGLETRSAAGVVLPGYDLPGHDEISLTRRAYEALSLMTAVGLLAAHAVRVARLPSHEWWLPAAGVAGAVFADFVSGVVHWAADTWGRETLPVIGRRLLRPFRVHHVNPDDFLRRSFLDVNGDVATIVVPFLLAAFALPAGTAWGRGAEVFVAAFCLVGLPTNQVHQWAHSRKPPRAVGWLQRSELILGRRAHARHHVAPYAQSYCIATGWCNRPLTALDFFPRLERLITRLTGLTPRDDDDAFRAGLGVPSGDRDDG